MLPSTPLERALQDLTAPDMDPEVGGKTARSQNFPPKEMPRALGYQNRPRSFRALPPTANTLSWGVNRPHWRSETRLCCFFLLPASLRLLYHLAVYPTCRGMRECPVLWVRRRKNSKQLSAGQMHQELRASGLDSRSLGVGHIPCSM